MSEDACEKSEDPGVIAEGITLAFLLYINRSIDTFIKNIYSNNTSIDNNRKQQVEIQANLILQRIQGVKSKNPIAIPKKRGRKPKYAPEELEEINVRRKELFSQFWAKYPRKESEAGALRWWLRIRGLELIFPQIMQALEWQIKAWEGGRYAPAPTKYILDKRWEDSPVKNNKPKFKEGLDFDFPAN